MNSILRQACSSYLQRILFLLIPAICLAKTMPAGPPPYEFIQNCGQWPEAFAYKMNLPGGALFVVDDGFVYHFYRQQSKRPEAGEFPVTASNGPDSGYDTDTAIHQQFHAYKVSFAGAVNKAIYEPQQQKDHYHNYFFGKDSSAWFTRVPLYDGLVRKHIYDGVDLKFYSHGSRLKYEFIVAPQVDPGCIRLLYEGVTPEITEDGDLKITTSVNEIIERAPYTFQVKEGRERPVKCVYVLEDNRLGYAFPEGFDRALPLIIDPDVVFATYSGSTSGLHFNNTTTFDYAGNLYTGALARSPGWPVTLGAYQVNEAGQGDVGINKYSDSGHRLLFSTYYGGRLVDKIHTMATNKDNHLIIAGSTNSTDLPTTSGCFDNTFNGNRDLFVACFNSTGTQLLGSTYIGGNQSEAHDALPGLQGISPVEIALDEKKNIWLASNTQSNDFPVTADALQDTTGGGYDGIICQFSADCSRLLYGTYLGGTGADAALAIQVDRHQNIVTCGMTGSPDFPTTKGALHEAAPGGSSDGFVSYIHTPSGSLLHSSYIGTPALDWAGRLQVDDQDKILLTGRTTGNYPITVTAFSIPSGDVFMDQLEGNLSRSLRSARLGNAPAQSRFIPTAFFADKCGNTYLSGLNAAPDLPTTLSPLDSNPSDFWVCCLSNNFEALLYASYFGAQQKDLFSNGVGVHRFSPYGILYHSMNTNNAAFPTSTYAAFPRKLNAETDHVSFKIDFKVPYPYADFSLAAGYRDSGCVPYTIRLSLHHYDPSNSYSWDFGDGSPPVAQLKNPEHTYTAPGKYRIRLVAHRDNGCILADSTIRELTVFNLEKPAIALKDTLLCNPADPIQISVKIDNTHPGQTIRWGPASGISGDSDGTSVWVSTTRHLQYYVSVTDSITGLCGITATDTLNISHAFLDMIAGLSVQPACNGQANGAASLPVSLEDTATAYTFTWKMNNDILSRDPVMHHAKAGPYSVSIQTASGCDTTLYFTIPEENIKVSFSSDTLGCAGILIHFSNNSPAYFTHFNWYFGAAGPDSGNHASHIFSAPGRYKVQLSGKGEYCADTVVKYITVDTIWVNAPFQPDRFHACVGQKITFSTSLASSMTHLLWQLGDGSVRHLFTDTVTHTYDRYGIMKVQRTAYFRACPALLYEDSVTIHPLPVVNFPPYPSLCAYSRNPVTLSPLLKEPFDRYTFRWNTGAVTPAIRVTQPGRYQLTVQDRHQCSTTEEVIIDKDCYIDIPNAFSPNGDLLNDHFIPLGLLAKGISHFKMTLYNRAGQIIFETTNSNSRGWDGKFNGKDQPQGVYVYVIVVGWEHGHEEQYKGNVTLIR